MEAKKGLGCHFRSGAKRLFRHVDSGTTRKPSMRQVECWPVSEDLTPQAGLNKLLSIWSAGKKPHRVRKAD
jgi:hypothetical protein